MVPNLDDDDQFTSSIGKAMLQMLDNEARRGYVEAVERLAPEYSFARLVSEYEMIYSRAGGWRASG